MPEINYLSAGTVELNGLRYELVRDPSTQLAYTRDYFPETPWEDGVPTIISRRISSWHGGGLMTQIPMDREVSSQRAPALFQSEYGRNTDPRWINRLAPSIKILTKALVGNTDPITCIGVGPLVSLNQAFEGYLYGVYAGSNDGIWLFPSQSVIANDELAADMVFDGAGAMIALYSLVYWNGTLYLTVGSSNSLYKGTPTTTEKLPSGAGTTAQFTPSAGSNFQNVDDAAADDDATYNSSSTTGHIDLFAYNNYGLAAPNVPGIIALSLRIRRTVTGTSDATMRGVCRVGGVNYFTTAITVADSTSYNTRTLYFPVNPATSAQWTWADIDAAEFGYELQTAPGAGAVRVTRLGISTTYFLWSTGTATAKWLAVGPRRMFKVDDASGVVLKNIEPTLDPTVEANWADEVTIPGSTLSSYGITGQYTTLGIGLVAYQKTAIVSTELGIHAVDSDGRGTKVVERLVPTSDTGMFPWDPWIYVPHTAGMYRWLPGLVESVGLEHYQYNRSPIVGYVTAMAFSGKWIFAAMTPPGENTFILVGREREGDDISPEPIIWDTLYETGTTAPIYSMVIIPRVNITTGADTLELFFETTGQDLGQITIPATGGAEELDSDNYLAVVSATRYTVELYFGDYHPKNFYKVSIKGLNLTSVTYWEFAYRIDGGSWVTTDRNTVNMRVNSDAVTEFYLPTTATGTRIQGRLTYTSDLDSHIGLIEYVEFSALPQSRRGSGLTMLLRLAKGTRHVDSIEERTAMEQEDALAALVEAAPITALGPWNETALTLSMKEFKIVRMTQVGNDMPELIVQISGQVRE